MKMEMEKEKAEAYDKLFSALLGERNKTFTDYPGLHLYIKGRSIEEAVWDIFDKITELYSKPATVRGVDIISDRFGLLTGKARSLEDLGQKYGVTKERIRQQEGKMLRIMRHGSRIKFLKPYLYHPSPEDNKAVAMRIRLYDELRALYPDKLSLRIATALRRPYLKKALRDISSGNIAEQVRKSCAIKIETCANCGQVTLPGWSYCCRECQKAANTLTLACEECGTLFPRRQTVTLDRLSKRGMKHYFCSRPCVYEYYKKHPEEIKRGRRGKKNELYQLFEEGYSWKDGKVLAIGLSSQTCYLYYYKWKKEKENVVQKV